MEIRLPRDQLSGRRIELRRYEAAHAATMFATIDEDRARLRTFLPWVDHIKTPEDEESFIRSATLQWLEGKLFDFGIFAREGGAYLGSIGAHSLSWDDERAELGYWLSGAAEGRGYVSEALALIEAELFRIGFFRIEIRCNARNARSAAVPRRAGYVYEGTLRQDVIEFAQRRDTMVWGKLRA